MSFEKTPGWLDWYAGPSKPHAKPVLVMVPAIRSLGERGATKFPGPHHQGIVQHSALLQVRNQRHTSAIDLSGL